MAFNGWRHRRPWKLTYHVGRPLTRPVKHAFIPLPARVLVTVHVGVMTLQMNPLFCQTHIYLHDKCHKRYNLSVSQAVTLPHKATHTTGIFYNKNKCIRNARRWRQYVVFNCHHDGWHPLYARVRSTNVCPCFSLFFYCKRGHKQTGTEGLNQESSCNFQPKQLRQILT